jgi:EmrB/QacA subfamily drug resistance transporter
MAGPIADLKQPLDRPSLTHRQILFILPSLLVGVMLASLDSTIVATSIKTIADYFHSYSLLAWATTSYLAASTITIPLYGKLSDLYGRKPCYLVAISVFALGSLACSFATSFYELTALRAFQGLGAGGLLSLAFTILGDLFAPRQRGKYQGYFIGVATVSTVLGYLIGGVLAGQQSILGIAGWRWVFLPNVPLGLTALVVVMRVLRVDRARRSGIRLDWLGSVMLIVAITPLLIVSELGRSWGWGSTRSIVCYTVFAAGVLGYVWAEKTADESALTPLRIFANRSFARGSVIALVSGAMTTGVIGIISQYFQVALGSDPAQAILLLMPAVVGLIVGTLASGQLIARTGQYRAQAIVGGAVTVVSLLGLYFLTGRSGLWLFMVLSLFFALGVGLFSQQLTLVMQNILPARDMGVSTGAVTFFRQLGGTIGTAAFLSLFFAYTPSAITSEVAAAADQPTYQAAVTQLIAPRAIRPTRTRHRATDKEHGVGGEYGGERQWSASVVAHSSPRPFQLAFADSTGLVFVAASGVGLLGLLLFIGWRPVMLRRHHSTGNSPAGRTAENSAMGRTANRRERQRSNNRGFASAAQQTEWG